MYGKVTIEKALPMVVGFQVMLIEQERLGVRYDEADCDK